MRNYEALGQAVEDDFAQGSTLGSGGQHVRSLAVDCKERGRKVLDLLQSLRVTTTSSGAKRVWQGTRKAARILRKRERLQQECEWVQAKTGHLAIALLQLILTDHGKHHTLSQNLLDAVAANHKDTVRTVLEARDQICQALQVQPQSTSSSERLFWNSILKSLGHQEMHSRRDGIPETYGNTYKWILIEPSSALRTWLVQGDSLFWLSGKAGSGKSTLMKFVANDAETKIALSKWADRRSYHLLTAEYYFWYAGTWLQKSVEGLLRELLTTIIKASAAAARIAFPSLWQQFEQAREAGSIKSWSSRILYTGLENLAAACGRGQLVDQDQKPYRFCFFIDGLDEYDGDYFELLKLIESLSNNSHIKMCVSSRAWNAFRIAFEATSPQLRLQDLTKPDIIAFVNGKLAEGVKDVNGWHSRCNFTTDEKNNLVNDIVEKAEGVFLWVQLVVGSIQEGLLDHDTFASLQQRVKELPADLAAYFRQMIRRVHGRYRTQTASVLRLAHAYVEFGSQPQRSSNFLDYWLFRDHPTLMQDHHFASNVEIRHCTGEDILEMERETQVFLNACCKDLLHLPLSSGRDTLSPQPLRKVEFLHRTVYDFLCGDEVQDDLCAASPNTYGMVNTFAQIAAARCKFIFVDDAQLATEVFNEGADVALTKADGDRHFNSLSSFALARVIDDVRLLYLNIFPAHSAAVFGIYKEKVVTSLDERGCNTEKQSKVIPYRIGGNAHFGSKDCQDEKVCAQCKKRKISGDPGLQHAHRDILESGLFANQFCVCISEQTRPDADGLGTC